MLLVTSRWVSPSCPALTRSTFRLNCGCSTTWWMCTSAAPGMRATGRAAAARSCSWLAALRPDHLQVDRRRQAEIENLIGDVGRLEEEHHVGELLGEPLAQLDFVVAHRAVPLAIERNQDLAVGGGDVRHIALRQAAPRVRNPDVVENRVDLAGGQRGADLAAPDRRSGPRSPRCGCPAASAHAAASVPASTSGKKSRPTSRTSSSEPSDTTTNPISTGVRCPSDQSSRPR